MTRYEELNGAYSNHIKDRHVVLFSGGLDSTATAVKLMQKNIKPLLLTIDTGAQDMPESIKIAREIAKELGLQHIINTDIKEYCQRTVVGTNLYIPRRNLLFALIGSTYGNYIYIAGIKGDFSPDKSPEVFQEFEDIINRSSNENEHIKFLDSILWNYDKIDVAELLKKAGYSKFLTTCLGCYNPKNGKHCGNCIACFRKWVMMKKLDIPTDKTFITDPAQGQGAEAYKELALSGEWHENIPVELVKEYLRLL